MLISDTRIYQCAFHRIQSWKRWIKRGTNKIDDKDAVEELLRNVADAESVEAFHRAVKILKTSTEWKSNAGLRN